MELDALSKKTQCIGGKPFLNMVSKILGAKRLSTLSVITSTPRTTIQSWEVHNKPSFELVLRLNYFFNIPITELLDGSYRQPAMMFKETYQLPKLDFLKGEALVNKLIELADTRTISVLAHVTGYTISNLCNYKRYGTTNHELMCRFIANGFGSVEDFIEPTTMDTVTSENHSRVIMNLSMISNRELAHEAIDTYISAQFREKRPNSKARVVIYDNNKEVKGDMTRLIQSAIDNNHERMKVILERMQ
ncbi:hypothetical protein [Vibrio barjaei]|uniref:hypothetical protein n=1 Tax=Vibrio barjaei TaxID=1676683 RepID=UPI002284BE1D|nr:hypothetical protein [Vibrio barjaei]MCY9874620.1 hypothetical protein [Vibrio barjaei]